LTGQYIDQNRNGLDDNAFLVNTTIVGNQSFPTTTMDELGNFVIAWQSDEGGASTGYHIYSRRYDSAVDAIGGETLVSAGLAISQKTPAVAAESAGNYVIVREGADSSGTGIFARCYFADGTANGEVFQVNSFTDLD
jgi:hypothetical protein